VSVYEVDGLNITLDEPLFPEQIDKPKALKHMFFS
jgi:hypothetical protein